MLLLLGGFISAFLSCPNLYRRNESSLVAPSLFKQFTLPVVYCLLNLLTLGFALADADGGIALDVVARVQQQGVRAPGLVLGFQGGCLGVSGDAAVDVVGVEDDDGAFQALALLRGAGGDAQGEHHRESQQQGQELLSLHSFTSSSLRGRIWPPPFLRTL